MWASFVFTANFLLLVNCESVCKSANTGTVLFRKIDMYRRDCWSQEELGMVYARRAFVELVPKQIPRNIPIILEYIQICMNTLKEVAKSPEVYEFLFAALADTFGGYLQTYGLPLLHESYYEGYVSYDTTTEFHHSLDNFKTVLMTNGRGWTKPMKVIKHNNRILPLKLPIAVGDNPCSLLMFYDNSTHKVSVREISEDETVSAIPLPIIDNNKHPISIAIPFKTRALYNLKSRLSYDILIKYYVEASRCLSVSENCDTDQMEFDKMFSNWLKTKVIPHLKDNDWYIGFSNVLRIQETIEQKGGMIVSGPTVEKEDDSLLAKLEDEIQMTKPFYFVIAIIILLSILFLCFLYWACIKYCVMCCGKVDLEGYDDENVSDQTTLLSPSEYSSQFSPARCKHNKTDGSNSQAQSDERSVSEKKCLRLSCGLGRKFPSRSNKHNH